VTIINTLVIQYTTGDSRVIKPIFEARKYPAVVVTDDTVGI
jgi:hypothetical protein